MNRISIFTLILLCTAATARMVEYDLTIAEQSVAPAGKAVTGLTINGSIPGPVLRFREGDVARITLRNRLPRETTSLHWHGLLVPNIADGMPRLTTPLIPAGTDHVYEYPLKHAGTYWYHSHTALQEQQGVYGAIVVAPKGGEPHRADRDYVLVLSDWTNEHPNTVMRTLMSGSEWYGIKKGTAQSIFGAARSGHLKDYWSREWSRMPAMDVSDVGYDAFLINGRCRIDLDARPGEKIRLRVINAGASTYFYVNAATGPLTIVAADGPPVRAIRQQRLLMGMAETYDVIITMPKSGGAWEFRATAQDGSGHASAFIGRGEERPAPDIPRPDPYDMTEAMSAALDEMDESAAVEPERDRPLPPYRRLQSLRPTTLPAKAPRRTLPLRLTGDMIRYNWSINGKPLKEDSTIRITRGEVLRLELINDTMMHHPMHLHGHFFRVLMDPDNPSPHAPLKHTVDVPPMSRRTIEFLANEYGDWFFHCHLLYHMESGMARAFSYDDQGPDHVPDTFCDCMPEYWFRLEGSAQSHLTEGSMLWANAKNDIGILWEAGWQDTEETEYEADLLFSRYLNTRWSVFAAARFTNHHDEEDRLVAGAVYTLPLLAKLTLTADSEGDFRAALAKEFQLTSRLSIFGRVEYDTGTEWDWQAGAHYTLSKNLGLILSHDSDYGFGGGLAFRF
jgi:FtsP/CotA-like multicopper oxidase with cupredoxin domain